MRLSYQSEVGTKFLKLMSSFTPIYCTIALSSPHLRRRVQNVLVLHRLPSSRRTLMVGPSCVVSGTACTFKCAVTHSTRTCGLFFLVMDCGVIKCNNTWPRQCLSVVTAKRHLLRLLTVECQSRHWTKHSTTSLALVTSSWKTSRSFMSWI